MIPTVTRAAALAGRWYAGEPAVLRRDCASLLAAGEPTPHRRVVCAVVPHAGHAWSGDVAGRVLGALREERYRRVVILAPNHRRPLRRPGVSGARAFATPLGEVAVDREAEEALTAAGAAEVAVEAHRDEHAVEIQLPLLQTLWDAPPPVVPLLVPHLDEPARAAAVAALTPLCDGATLVLVSTDFTHYGRDFGYLPFTEDVPERLEILDRGAIDRILAWDADGLLDYGRETGVTMCGLEAAALAMALPWPRRPEPVLLDYARSGDRDGDYELSVSYAGLLASWPAEETP